MEKIPVTLTDEARLARRINETLEEAKVALGRSLLRSIECGNLLLEAKKLIAHGSWTGWLEANTDVRPRTAQKLMRLAKNHDVIRIKAPDPTHLAIDTALDLVAKKKYGAGQIKGDGRSSSGNQPANPLAPGLQAAMNSFLNEAKMKGDVSQVFRSIELITEIGITPREAANAFRKQLRSISRETGRTASSEKAIINMLNAAIAWLQDFSVSMQQPQTAAPKLRAVSRDEEES